MSTAKWIPRLGVIAVLAFATSACWWRSGRNAPAPATVSLIVSNRSFFDVNVYALQTIGGPANRIGTVAGFADAELRLRPTDLQLGGILVVRLHAIGTNRWWTSPSVQVDSAVVAHLEIYSDAEGDLSRSTLYTMIASTATAH